MRIIHSLVPLAMVASVAAQPAAAQIADPAMPETVAEAMRAAGYKAQVGKDTAGDPKISSAASGASFTVYFYGCEANKNCRSVQFATDYAVKTPVPLAKINEWNQGNRFGAAYLDKDGAPALQWDVVMEGGMPAKLFGDTVDRWATAMAGYQTHIGW